MKHQIERDLQAFAKTDIETALRAFSGSDLRFESIGLSL